VLSASAEFIERRHLQISSLGSSTFEQSQAPH